MKIKISEDEVYEIKMPEEIGIEDFQNIVARFNFLIKNFTKFSFGNSQPREAGEIILQGDAVKTYKKYNKERWNTLRDNREIFLELLKTYYFGTREEFEKVLKKHGLNFKRTDMASGNIIALREYHNINPRELGLRKFPTRNERINDLRLGDDEK
jgi:hypothetical protein